jgi:hypothetical protein
VETGATGWGHGTVRSRDWSYDATTYTCMSARELVSIAHPDTVHLLLIAVICSADSGHPPGPATNLTVRLLPSLQVLPDRPEGTPAPVRAAAAHRHRRPGSPASPLAPGADSSPTWNCVTAVGILDSYSPADLDPYDYAVGNPANPSETPTDCGPPARPAPAPPNGPASPATTSRTSLTGAPSGTLWAVS